MGTVFQSICAEVSSEFEAALSDNEAMMFLEKVCDLTGTLIISNSLSVSPSSLKICGSWAAVSQTHNILSAYNVMKDLMKKENSKETPTLQEAVTEESQTPPPKRKRGRPTKHSPRISSAEIIEKLINKHSPRNICPSSLLSPELIHVDKSFSKKSPVPVRLVSTDSNQSIPVLQETNECPENAMKTGSKLSDDGKDFESNMYLMNNMTSNSTGSSTKDNNSPIDDENLFSCSMCNYQTNNARNLEAHLDRFHFKPVTCHICGRGFGYERDLKRHLLKNKYSCGSRRSVINENYVKTKNEDDTEEQLNNSSDDYAKTNDTQISSLHDAEMSNNEQIESSNFELNMKIKEEPFDVDESMDSNVSTDFSSETRQDINPSTNTKTNAENSDVSDREVLSAEYSNEMENLGSNFVDTNIPTKNAYNEHTITNIIVSPSLANDGHFPPLSDSCNEDDFTFELNTYSCKHCAYSAVKKQNIVDHVCRRHKKQFSCDHCRSMFGLVKDLNRHLKCTHGIVIPPRH